MPRVLSLLLLLCVPLGAVLDAQDWKIALRSQDFQNFDRDIDAFWMSQQGVLFLQPSKLVVYQVKRSAEPAKLATRGSTGGAGNFILCIKALGVDDGRLIKSLELPTSGSISSVMATQGGRLLVRTGNALYVFSEDFAPIASRTFPTDKQGNGEGWQVKVTPSGAEAVLLYQQHPPAKSATDDDPPSDDDDPPGSVEILDPETLRPKKTFTLLHIPFFWTPADDLLLSSNPTASQSDSAVGLLDFEGKWSPMPASFAQLENSCRFTVRAIDQHRFILYGCDAVSVYSEGGKRLFSYYDQRFVFRSVAASGSYLAAAEDHYRLGRDTWDGEASASTRPDRIGVYDLERHHRLRSFRVRSPRVYYAISAQGDLALIDGANLEMLRTRR